MAFDPNKKFLYFNLDTTIGEMDSSLCFPVSSFVGAETQTSAAIHLHFKGSKGTDSTIVRVSHDQVGLIKTFYQNLVNEINFGEKAFIKVHDYGQRGISPSDVSFRMKSLTAPTFTLQDTDFIVAGDSLTFDSVQLTGIQTSLESFVDNDISLMTSAAIDDRINTAIAASSAVSVSDSTANTDFPVVFHDESNNLHDDTGAFEYNPSTGNLTVSKITGCEIDTDGNTITLNGGEIQDVLTYTGADITVSGTIKSTGTTNDYSEWSTSTNGATTFSTVDAAGADAHFEIAADGNIVLDAAGDITLETANGGFTCDAASVNFTGTGASRPSFNLVNNANDATGPNLALKNLRDGNGLEDSDVIGNIEFSGEDVAGQTETYATIVASVAEADNADEAGQIAISVANDGTLRNGITMTGDKGTAQEVDVTIASGAASTTTIAGNLNVNGEDHMFSSGTNAKPAIVLRSGGTSQIGANLTFQRSATGADNTNIGDIYFIGKNEADEDINYAHIVVDTADASDGAEEGQMLLSVASHDGELQPGLNLISGNLEDEVDATIGNGANSLVTVPGKLSIGTRIDFDSTSITAIQTAAESFADNDSSLMTSAAIDDRINAAAGGVTADPFSTTVIKILPHQFMINDDAGRPAMIEDDTSNTLGVRCASTSDEMYAFQKIPTGYKVTHVQVHASASTSSAVTARSYNYQTGADNTISSTTGDFNANIDITDIPAHATTDLVIKVAPASNSTIIYGATVTIATI